MLLLLFILKYMAVLLQ